MRGTQQRMAKAIQKAQSFFYQSSKAEGRSIMNRAQRRAAAKRNKKQEEPQNSEVEQKMALFGKLPDECQQVEMSSDGLDSSEEI